MRTSTSGGLNRSKTSPSSTGGVSPKNRAFRNQPTRLPSSRAVRLLGRTRVVRSHASDRAPAAMVVMPSGRTQVPETVARME